MDHRPAVVDQPVVAVLIAPEQVFGGHPGVGGGEDATFDGRRRIHGTAGVGEQHADLVGVGPSHESSVVLENQVVLCVVRSQFDVAAARQRPSLAAQLGARDVGQYRLPVGGGEEL